jgi:ketosteroid isomerase-like protein
MKETIEKFYSSFAALDAESMAACYHDDATFEDPAFGKLNSEQAKSMWKMLLGSQKGKEFIVTYSDIEGSNNEGSAKWEAKYSFSKTGRSVHNKIQSSFKFKFKFKDGLIIKHVDDFNGSCPIVVGYA